MPYGNPALALARGLPIDASCALIPQGPGTPGPVLVPEKRADFLRVEFREKSLEVEALGDHRQAAIFVVGPLLFGAVPI
jgi:hypothetical protein